MFRLTRLATVTWACWSSLHLAAAGEVLFEDSFDGKLSPEWRAVGLQADDYRIRDGALEMRVQSGRLTGDTSMLMVLLPFRTSELVTATVDVTLLDRFTEPDESAGIFLTDDDSREFGGQKRFLSGHLVFSPGAVEFIGEDGEEGDPQQYALKFWPANQADGPLRIVVRGDHAHFQVGPSQNGKYRTFFHSAVRADEPQRGFCLSTSGGPADGEHWVRFDNFRVVRD